MATAIADLFVVLDSVTDPFSSGLKKAASDAESSTSRITSVLGTIAKVGLGIAAGVTVIGVEAIKAAGTFNSQMTLLNTQAGVSKGQIGYLSDSVLSLAGQVGFSPDSLAAALFHIESSFASVGITGPQAMNLLRVAAEGAATGHADLVDVTNALDAAVVSGIPGVQNLDQAMGQLNATVGAGDMTMQDLADAFSTGLLATVKGYGLSITDVGAALAVFGDNNIRGAVAATDLRMAVQSLAVPAKGGAAELEKLGLQTDTLAKDMQSGGLLKALEDLKQHMIDAGVTTQQQGEVITTLFGKKAGTGLNVLIDQLDRVQSKYPDLIKGATGFSDAWETTKNTFSQQIKSIQAEADALSIRLGNILLPQVSKLLSESQTALSGLVSGFSGSATQAVSHPNLGNRMLNQEAAQPPPLTGWQQFGQEVRRDLDDIGSALTRLKPVGQDFLTFGEDAYQALGKLLTAAQPVAQLLGGALFLGVETVGKTLANVAGPAIKDFANFLASHQELIRVFAEVILGGLILKMTVLGTLNAAKGILGLATSILQFPVSQAGDIVKAVTAVKTAWTGAEAAEGEQAVLGVAGAWGKLKDAVGGFIDRFANGAQLSGLAKVAGDMQGVEQAASQSEQLSLFETGVSGVEQEASKAETSVGRLGSTIGKLGMIGLAIGAVGALGDAIGHLAGVGDHTGGQLDLLTKTLQNAAMGSGEARDQFVHFADGMAYMHTKTGVALQGLTDSDTALAQLVTSGHADQAKLIFQQVADSLAKQGINAKSAAGDFPQYESAVKLAGDAAQTADGQVQTLTGTLDKQQSITQFNSDLNNLTSSFQANKGTLLDNTDAAIANQQAFQQAGRDIVEYYQQQRNAGVSVAIASSTMQNQIDALEQTGIQAGFTKGDVDQYLKTLGLIPSDIGTTLTANAAPAYNVLSDFIRTVDTSSAVVTIYGNTAGTTAGTSQMARGGGARASGGPVAADQVYWVGEDGPEWFVPGVSGYITPTSMIKPAVLAGLGGSGTAGYGSSGGSTVVNNYFITQVAGSVLSDRDVSDVVRTQVLQYLGHNGRNGLSVPALR